MISTENVGRWGCGMVVWFWEGEDGEERVGVWTFDGMLSFVVLLTSKTKNKR